ncbi:hypothetical protein [Halorubellus sp. PRR65]|uniref:hypothetical protein n=1 Tax=Halorubellus sp. PRR65 TaxID=3098148 RepID=UPI002B25A90B|nr:hypothetical protein [Halorubellus sp. PRR65]
MHASAGWYGDHTVDATSDGVTVRKGLDLDTLALPALKFEIRSEREDPVGVRVVDRLPTAVDPDRVGVHADFGADQWTAFEDGRVTFTTRLDPERPVVTLYGIWIDDPSRVHELLKGPDVKVATDPDAPSLDPVGDEVRLPTVDDSLRSVGPSALEDLRADVEEALTGARAEPAEPATALPAPDGDDGNRDGDVTEPAGTMGDHAWAYPVERRGTGRIAAPTHADLDDLVDDEVDADGDRGRGRDVVGENHVYLRAALTDTHHGGGGALLLQELANAFQVVARRITGDAERATVDAVVETPLGTDAVLSALTDREQVTDALVSPLVGDREDATGIGAEPEEETETAAREGTEEVSIEPDDEDVEVVLNADGERFSELQAEFEQETDTDALEDELRELELPGVDTSEEPSIDDLVAGDDAFDDDGADGFVPASVDGDDESFSFDDADATDGTELDFAADVTEDADVTADDGTASADDGLASADDGAGVDASTASADEAPFDFTADAAEATFVDADATGADDDGDHTDDDGHDPLLDLAVDDDATDDPVAADATDDTVAADQASADAPTAATADATTVEVPARELAALRTEMRELRDRVATLESELAAVRTDLPRERGVDSTPTVGDGGDSFEHVDGVDEDD